MSRRVQAKKITRKQAQSYERTVANPMGVTTIASVNGPRAYASRYAATRALLGKPKPNKKSTKGRKRAQSSARKRTSEARKSMRRGTSTSARRSASRRTTPNKRRRTTKKRSTRKKATKRTQSRVYGRGKYKALRARIGPKSRPTYMYATRKGNVRKIPKHGILGYESSAQMSAAHRRSPKRAEQDAARWSRVEKRRGRASISAVEGRDPFTPNRRTGPARTITYEEWEETMRANPRRRKKTTKKRRTTKKRASKRRVKRASPRRRATTKRRKTTARRKKATTRRRKTTKKRATRRKASTRRRKATTARRRKATTRRRKTTKRRATRRKTTSRRRAAPKRRRVTRRRKSTTRRRSAPKRRVTRRRTSTKRRGRSVTATATATVNRRRRARRNRRGFLRNQAATYTKDLMQVLKVGGIVVVGYLAHRAVTRVVSDSLLGGLAMFQSGTAAAYKDVAAGALVAAVAVPLAAKFAPKDSKLIGAGIAASWLQNAIVTVLTQMGQEDIVAYLGDYTEAEGSPQYSGMGSYYEFQPGQVFGEYYTMPGMSGFGNDLRTSQVMQAAAGLPQLYQAAASYNGFGANGGPMLTQAAAGVGEYIIQGANGIGEYEEVTPQYTAPSMMDEGISPDLDSAERALSIAEAAAGIGNFGDNTVPMQSTVYPTGQPEAIPDMPGGSRAGTFAGNNGIFGPGH